MADLLYSDAERALVDALGTLLADRCGWDKVLARTESAQGESAQGESAQGESAGTYDADLWHSVATDLGCAGLLIPERTGGAGASYREAASAAETLGGYVAPVPFLGSAVVATAALLACTASGSAEAEHLLGRMADGGLTVALAVPFALAGGAALPVSVRIAGPHPGDNRAGWSRLRGSVTGVADALPAGLLLVPADGVPRGLYAVDMSTARAVRTPVVSLDMTRQLCDISFDDAPATVVVSGDAASRAVDAALRAGAGLLAAELLGVAQRCLDMTLAYVKQRRQFARQVGSFQAVKHRLADVWVRVGQARAASRYAADCLARSDRDAEVAVALAKSYCSEVAVHAAQECVQLHGGIGFTWEHPAHLYLKRAKADSVGFGTADQHRAALARMVNIPAP
jgi:alkylation response protein AidB-like acyl-CoA dehydrogenase